MCASVNLLPAGNSSLTAFADFAVAYFKYCDVSAPLDPKSHGSAPLAPRPPPFAVPHTRTLSTRQGGSFTGTREDPVRASDGTLLYYRGQRNVDAMVADLQQNHGLSQAKEVIISGCSAGGMACYIHCDKMAEALHPIPVKCVCDAGRLFWGCAGMNYSYLIFLLHSLFMLIARAH
jgi:hypothetical protein